MLPCNYCNVIVLLSPCCRRLGVLTYVMLTAHSPFAGKDNQETFLNISQVNLDFPDSLFHDTSPLAQDFITKLLVKEPEYVLNE